MEGVATSGMAKKKMKGGKGKSKWKRVRSKPFYQNEQPRRRLGSDSLCKRVEAVKGRTSGTI